MEHEKCGFSLQCSAPPFTHKKQLYSTLLCCGFCFFLSLRKTSSYSFLFWGWSSPRVGKELWLHIHGGRISRIFHILFNRRIIHSRYQPPLFFLNSLGSLPFVSSTVKCRMIHRKKLNTHTTFRSEAGYICIPSAALRESGTKAQVTTEFFATHRPDHRRDIFLIPSDLIRMMKIRCYSTSLFVALWKRNPLECFERHQVSEEVAVYRVFGCGSIEDVTRRQRIPVS